MDTLKIKKADLIERLTDRLPVAERLDAAAAAAHAKQVAKIAVLRRKSIIKQLERKTAHAEELLALPDNELAELNRYGSEAHGLITVDGAACPVSRVNAINTALENLEMDARTSFSLDLHDSWRHLMSLGRNKTGSTVCK